MTMSRALLAAALMTLAAGPAMAMGGATQPVPSAEYARGEKAAKEGRYTEAVDLLAKVVKADPRNADAYNYLGFSYRKLGRTDAAAEAYQSALAADPNHKPSLEYYGELFLVLKQPAQAELQLAKLANLCPSGCAERGELERAIAAYKAANPGS